MLQAGRSQVPVPMRSQIFFNLPNPFGRTRLLGLPVSNRNDYQKHNIMFLGRKARPVPEANLIAICEPTV
jgi:hypothetical protein